MYTNKLILRALILNFRRAKLEWERIVLTDSEASEPNTIEKPRMDTNERE